MKPLSERIKKFDNTQFVDWLCLACVDVREVRTPDAAQEEIDKIRSALTERLSALEQRAEAAEAWVKTAERTMDHQANVITQLGLRAEAAEAKLAGREKQEPIAWIFEDELPENYPYDAMFPYSKVDVVRMFPVFGPAPAVSLAELVPDSENHCPKQGPHEWVHHVPFYKDEYEECNKCGQRRNIEEAK